MRANVLLCLVACLAACGERGDGGRAADEAAVAGRVDAARLAANEPAQWLLPGRDAAGTYYSPLHRIRADNVAELGFAWDYRLGTARGLEATPIFVDGVLYFSGVWGRVYAVDARTGRARWTYDPGIDGQYGRYPCCDAVNRGLVVWRGRVYVGALDGWLHALDAATGEPVWKSDTFIARDPQHPYTITGAPLVAGDVVIVGNSGADFGVRGYVSAYDLETGALVWRFYTVPRDPGLGAQDQPHLVRAAETWDPKSRWEFGGGGTVWDGMAYDAQARLVYIGTGNSSPYDATERSPAGGDNLYLVSIIAIHADTGEMAWYYQQVPNERWDYTATAKMILADLPWQGATRKVLMQAPKNGFFYVLDRETGELLSADPYAYVNWATGIDPKTGRPLVNEGLDYKKGPVVVAPGMGGAHNWNPMSMSAQSGLVYIPVTEMPMVYIDTSKSRVGAMDGWFATAGLPPEDYQPEAFESLFGALPALETLTGGDPNLASTRGVLRAWDPVGRRVAWEVPLARCCGSGILSTAGNLVFQGDSDGWLRAYAADSGRLLHAIETGTSLMAAPMTYELDGEQYVAVLAGHGGGGFSVYAPGSAAHRFGNAGRLLVFKLGGGPVPLPEIVEDAPFPEPPSRVGTPEQIADGEVLFARHCLRCHGFGRGLMPDLRRTSADTHRIFLDIVLRGAYAPKGMGRFDDVLTEDGARAVQAYVLDRAWAAYLDERAGAP